MADLTWEVPVCALAVMMAFRIVAAPFLLHREQAQDADRRLKRAARKRSNDRKELSVLREQLDDRQKKEVAKRVLANLLAIGESLIQESQQINDSTCQSFCQRYEEWNRACYSQIRDILGEAEAQSANTRRGLPLTTFNIPKDASNVVNWIMWRMAAIQGLISDLN